MEREQINKYRDIIAERERGGGTGEVCNLIVIIKESLSFCVCISDVLVVIAHVYGTCVRAHVPLDK